MRWEDLLRTIGDEPVFTAISLMAGVRSPDLIRRQLRRWVQAEKIMMLRRGVYAIRDPYARRPLHPFIAANALRKASYVSLQSALSYHGMVPEHVPGVTSVTTRRPESVETPIGRFTFRHVDHRLFFGYGEREVARGQSARLAGPEKALLDLLYLTPGSDDRDYLRELRLEWDVKFDCAYFETCVERVDSPKVVRAARHLRALREEQDISIAL